VARKLALPATDIEHRNQPLRQQSLGDALVDVLDERVPAQHRAREPKALRAVIVVGRNGASSRPAWHDLRLPRFEDDRARTITLTR
jgi:hypothetical protein